MNKFRKALYGASLAIAGVLSTAGVAGATTPVPVEQQVSDQASEVTGFLTGTAAPAIFAVLGVAIITALGVKYVRRAMKQA